MLNDMFWDKSSCDGIGLKFFFKVVSYELDFKNKNALAKDIQPYLHFGWEGV